MQTHICKHRCNVHKYTNKNTDKTKIKWCNNPLTLDIYNKLSRMR